MSRQKARWIFLLALSVLVAVLLSGCQFGENFPFYLMEEHEDYSEVLYIDGIKYERRLTREDKEAYKQHSGSRYCWTTAEGIGEQIGVCGDEATQYAELKIYDVVGDEEHIFLYTFPAHFYFGGTDYRLWRQEGVILNEPSVETVSSVSLVYHEEPLFKVDDPAMIAAFMEVYHSDTQQAMDIENGGDWQGCSLIMHHKDYPFLQYAIECCCSLEQGTACYRTSALGDWFPLPAEWYAVISEHDFPTRGE